MKLDYAQRQSKNRVKANVYGPEGVWPEMGDMEEGPTPREASELSTLIRPAAGPSFARALDTTSSLMKSLDIVTGRLNAPPPPGGPPRVVVGGDNLGDVTVT